VEYIAENRANIDALFTVACALFIVPKSMPSLSQVHRPKTFAEVTGQTHVTETLRKEVTSGILGHAFLFCGPRGVGKTTTARILAKALHCENPSDGEPCNSCNACNATNEGKQLDLIEQDAATHNGVDDVRELIEHVRFAPFGGKRKVYVLDEAHMLSGAAWNALLKTLEEPPPYAFFIFATTEWHKIPATIVSRCQRFEFKRIPDAELSDRVRDIAKAEGMTLSDDVVRLIVSRSDGCVRDAETLLGQISSLGGKEITLETASLVIPQGYDDLASGLIATWGRRDHAEALRVAQCLADDGVPLVTFFDDLIAQVRKMLIDSGDTSKPQPFSPGELNDLALLLFERRKDAKSGIDALFALQLAGTIAANGLLRHASRTTPATNVATPPPGGGDARKNLLLSEEEKARGGASPSPKAQEKTKPHIESQIEEKEESREVVNAVKEDGEKTVIDLNAVRMKWQAVIRTVDAQNHSLPFILKISRPEEVRGSTVIVRFQYAFHLDKIVGDPKNRLIVEKSMEEVYGTRLALDGVVGEDDTRAEARSQDIVSNILKAFGGNVVES
jgi:DNA polymerase-3 subunit gamma/tau